MPTLPGREKLDCKLFARRITTEFNPIGETPDAEACDATLFDKLIENTGCVRKLIAAASVALDDLVK